MKLKAIHTYQYVKFGGKNENFLSAKIGMEDLELEYLPSVNGVSVKTAKDHVIVFTTNIAYAVPMTEETAKRDVSKRGQIVDNVPSSPRKNF